MWHHCLTFRLQYLCHQSRTTYVEFVFFPDIVNRHCFTPYIEFLSTDWLTLCCAYEGGKHRGIFTNGPPIKSQKQVWHHTSTQNIKTLGLWVFFTYMLFNFLILIQCDTLPLDLNSNTLILLNIDFNCICLAASGENSSECEKFAILLLLNVKLLLNWYCNWEIYLILILIPMDTLKPWFMLASCYYWIENYVQ